MTQEEKSLLFKDLCARLPYRAMVKCTTDYRHEFDEELSEIHIMNFYQFEIKPYLRPMSSMTDAEKKAFPFPYYFDWIDSNFSLLCSNDKVCASIGFDEMYEIIDWLNKKMFAYRTIGGKDMFELGIALKAPEGMYK